MTPIIKFHTPGGSSGMTMLQLLIAMAILSTVFAVAFITVTNVSGNIGTQKLTVDVASLNASLRVYEANGGDLSGVTSPVEALARLKTVAANGKQIAGIRGSLIDSRLDVAWVSTDGGSRAVWDAEHSRFALAKSGRGVRAFVLNDAWAALPVAEETRTANLKFATVDGWVWDYKDRPALTANILPHRGSAPTAAGIDPDPAPSPSILQPPLISKNGGSYPYEFFDLPVYLANSNPTGTSTLLLSKNPGIWREYEGGAIYVTSGETLQAQAISKDPMNWLDSDTISHTYQADPLTMGIALAIGVMRIDSPESTATASETFTTVADGDWSSGSTWAAGVAPSGRMGGRSVVINHRVTYGGDDLYIENGSLTVSGVLVIANQNIKMEHTDGILKVNRGLILLNNSNLENKSGTVNLTSGAVQLCNGNYTDESSGSVRGTTGTGYIFSRNGNIERKGSAPFSNTIAWNAPGGNGVGLPTPGDPEIDPLGCDDERFYQTLLPVPDPKLSYTYLFSNKTGRAIRISFFDGLPSGIQWDPAYTPVTSGGLSVRSLAYSGGNANASIGTLMLPVGESTLTLQTLGTSRRGTITNEATMTQAGSDPVTAKASIDL